VANVLQQTKMGPSVIDGFERTVARGDSRCKAEKVCLMGRFL
jgi:hypothetical protein